MAHLRVNKEWVAPGKAHEDAVFDRMSIARETHDCPSSNLAKSGWAGRSGNMAVIVAADREH